MAVYLIDFENVSSAGISGVQQLTKEDKVYIFYTANAASMSFAAHLNLLSSAAEVAYFQVASGGNNALDFQLASFLGYLISERKHKNFYIISNDKGYDHVKNFWERSGIAEGMTIYSAPSIKRSLVSIEKPLAVKPQQDGQINEEADKLVKEIAASEISENSEESLNETENNKKETEKVSQKNTKAASKEAAMESLRKAVRPLLEKAGINSGGDVINIANHLKSADGKQQFYCKLTKAYGMEKGLKAYQALRTEYSNLTKIVK